MNICPVCKLGRLTQFIENNEYMSKCDRCNSVVITSEDAEKTNTLIKTKTYKKVDI